VFSPFAGAGAIIFYMFWNSAINLVLVSFTHKLYGFKPIFCFTILELIAVQLISTNT